MQLKRFLVNGLFGRFNHKIEFPIRAETNKDPSIVILCGENGIGKTSILQMIEGFKTLDFSIFRKVPFTSAQLTFSDDSSVSVKPTKVKSGSRQSGCLRVRYKGLTADLHRKHSGPLVDKDSGKVEHFRKHFFNDTVSIQLELVSTSRLQALYEEHTRRLQENEQTEDFEEEFGRGARRHMMGDPEREHTALLSERVSAFIRDAQLNYRRFFSSGKPDLFQKIIERLASAGTVEYRSEDLVERLKSVKTLDDVCDKYGFFKEDWDMAQLARILNRKGGSAPDEHALAVVNTYIEFLESRSAERKLLIDRVQTFETTVNKFLRHKTVKVHAQDGLRIADDTGAELREFQLSSGEYHLVYLLTVALTTQRRGTVIAIDEPELSMHLAWQRQLVGGILRCASMAQPQVIIATHSPDIAAEYKRNCVTLE